jgi:hypothetical protein
MSFQALTDRQVEFITREIQLESYHRTRAYSYFKANNLIEPIGQGLRKTRTNVLKKMKPGQISFGTESLPDSHMRIDLVTSKVALIGTIVVLNKRDLDAWKSNSSNIRSRQGGPMGFAVAEQIQELYDFVDRFLFYGDDIRNPIDNEDWVGAGDFTGLMNGFSSHAGGAGSDNNTSAAGDYMITCDRMIKKLKEAGWDSDQYVIFSDLTVWNAAASGNNFYSTMGNIERDIVIQRSDIASWQASPNCIDNAGTAYRMALTSPSVGKGAKGRKKRTKPYKLLESYPFSVFPLYGGGMDKQMNYNVAVIWSGVLEETHADALYRTATLTT